MIDLSKLEVRYNGHPAVHVDHLSVQPGEWLGIVGPNGAGKSSLLNAIAGIIPFTGNLEIQGRPPTDRRGWARSVAWVPQRPLIPSGMSVLDYVLLGRYSHLPYWGMERPEDVEMARRQLAAVDMAGFEDRMADRLSGGEQQRMTVARALAQESPVLLLDEPTASLDLGHQVGVLELVDELRKTRGLAVAAAMHDLTLAGRFADELLLLVDGSVHALGEPARILRPALLTEAYGTRVQVLTDDEGRSVVLPG